MADDHSDNRDRSRDAHWTWSGATLAAGRAAIIDVDGVISEASARQHFLEGPRKDWRGFFEACDQDPVIDETRTLLHALETDLRVVLLTARPAWVQEKTVDWLGRHEVRWDLLVMRGYRDQRSSTIFKKEALQALIEHPFDPVFAIEDDLRNAEMFRAHGVPCLYRHSGYYE
ncbi:MAG: hypothetical protein WBD02_05550 [Acidimicrobiia bacterium]